MSKDRVKELCNELASLVGGGEGLVTILVRHPDNPTKGILATEDDIEQIIPAIQRFAFRN